MSPFFPVMVRTIKFLSIFYVKSKKYFCFYLDNLLKGTYYYMRYSNRILEKDDLYEYISAKAGRAARLAIQAIYTINRFLALPDTRQN